MRGNRLFVFIVGILLSAFLVACTQESSGENDSEGEWPDGGEFTYIVGYDPGGSVDGTARITAPYLEEELGVPVTIQNTPGSGNLVGLNEAFSRPSDGLAWTYGSTVDGPWPHYYLSPSGTPWELDDWKSLGIYGQLANMGLAATHDAPWDDFADLILDARERPGEITFASLGPGRFDDIWVLELQEFFDVEFNWVFYDSSGSIQTDLLTGDIDVGLIQTQREDFVDHAEFNVLTAVGTDLPEDYPYDFPTLRDFEEELNFSVDDLKALKIQTTNTFLVKADTPDHIYQELVKVAKSIFENPEWKEKMISYTWPTYIPPEEAEKHYQELSEVIESYQSLHEEQVQNR